MTLDWFGPTITTQYTPFISHNNTNHHHNGVKAGWAWWSLMTTISIFNLILLAVVLKRHRSLRDSREPAWERRIRRVAAIVFTVVCAYRSILPRVDVPRMCWFDTPLNWIVFGRTGSCVCACACARLPCLYGCVCVLKTDQPSVLCNATCVWS